MYKIPNIKDFSSIKSRDNTGYFTIYFNSTPVLEAIDTTVTTSYGFAMAVASGDAFDNVVVSDSVDMDLVAPYIIENPTDQTIAFGDDFSYKLNATDFSGVVTRGINDTAQFAISNDGLKTNTMELEPGIYGLEVGVADEDLYTRAVSFSLAVEDVPPPIDSTLQIVAGEAVAVVVIIMLLIFMKKRS